MRSLLILCGTLVPLLLLFAQPPQEFTPSPYWPLDSLDFKVAISAKSSQAKQEAPAEHLNFFLDKITEREEELLEQSQDSSFLFNPELSAYLEGIFSTIITANQIDLEPIVLVSRSPRINAYSMGHGIFMVNLGLLEKLTKEDALAFVFAHELAHDQLLHQRETFTELSLGSEDREAVFEKLNRRRTGKRKRERLMGQLRNEVYQLSRNSRRHELAADSLGLVYLAKTDYSTSVGRATLDELGYNPFFDLGGLSIDSVLQTEGYPFKGKWLVNEEVSLFGDNTGDDGENEFWERDSVASHPEGPARIAAIDSLMLSVVGEVTDEDQVGKLHPYSVLAGYESLAFFLDAKLPAHSLITALRLLQNYPKDTYLRAAVGRSLLNAFLVTTDQSFASSVPPTGYFYEQSAVDATRLLHQIRQSELRKLTLAYLREQAAQYPESTHLKDTLAEAEELMKRD